MKKMVSIQNRKKKAKRIVKAWNVLWPSNGALESEKKNLSREKGNKREMTKVAISYSTFN